MVSLVADPLHPSISKYTYSLKPKTVGEIAACLRTIILNFWEYFCNCDPQVSKYFDLSGPVLWLCRGDDTERVERKLSDLELYFDPYDGYYMDMWMECNIAVKPEATETETEHFWAQYVVKPKVGGGLFDIIKAGNSLPAECNIAGTHSYPAGCIIFRLRWSLNYNQDFTLT